MVGKKTDRRAGFTTMEMVIVLALVVTLSGFSFGYAAYQRQNVANNTRVLQVMMSDAVAGYFGLVGDYPPVIRPLLGQRNQELTPQESAQLIEDLGFAAGYAILPERELANYKLIVTYPNEYILSIETIRR